MDSPKGIIGITDNGDETFIPFEGSVLDCSNFTFSRYRIALDYPVTMCMLGADYKSIPFQRPDPVTPVDPGTDTPQQPTDESQTWRPVMLANVLNVAQRSVGVLFLYQLTVDRWTPQSRRTDDRCHIYGVLDSNGNVIGTVSESLDSNTETTTLQISYDIYAKLQDNPTAYRVAIYEAVPQKVPNAKAPRLLKRSDKLVSVSGDYATFGPWQTLIEEPPNTSLGPQHCEIIVPGLLNQIIGYAQVKNNQPTVHTWPSMSGMVNEYSQLLFWEIPLAPGEQMEFLPLPTDR